MQEPQACMQCSRSATGERMGGCEESAASNGRGVGQKRMAGVPGRKVSAGVGANKNDVGWVNRCGRDARCDRERSMAAVGAGRAMGGGVRCTHKNGKKRGLKNTMRQVGGSSHSQQAGLCGHGDGWLKWAGRRHTCMGHPFTGVSVRERLHVHNSRCMLGIAGATLGVGWQGVAPVGDACRAWGAEAQQIQAGSVGEHEALALPVALVQRHLQQGQPLK